MFGVCIPYSAIVPLILIVLQFFAAPLAKMGLLPDFVAKKLGIAITGADSSSCANKSCCEAETKPTKRREKKSTNKASCSTSTSTDTSIIYEVTDSDSFQNLIQSKELVFVKFTAEWCKPCKQIHPFYKELATEYRGKSGGEISIAFTTVDVDEVDDVAGEFNVKMMPTFVAIRDGKLVDQTSGSNEAKLQTFVQDIVGV